MAPTRRVKTARAASQRPPFPPTPSGSEEYSDHDMDPDTNYNPSSTHPRASPYHRHAQGAYPLQRGTACLSCRKRKMVRVPVSVDSYPIIRLSPPSLPLFIRNAMAQSPFANSVPRQTAPPIVNTTMASPRHALSSSRRRSSALSRDFISSKVYPLFLLSSNLPTPVALYHTLLLHKATLWTYPYIPQRSPTARVTPTQSVSTAAQETPLPLQIVKPTSMRISSRLLHNRLSSSLPMSS